MQYSYNPPILIIIDFDTKIRIYQQLQQLSTMKILQSYINEKRILLNGKPLVNNQYVANSDVITIQLPNEKIDYSLDRESINVVYEDDILLIVNKPRHIIIYDIKKDSANTLCSHVARYYYDTKQQHTIHYLHRLDRDTSGCVIFVKHKFFKPNLDVALANKDIKRDYVALINGKLNKDITINAPIGNVNHDKTRRRVDFKHGKNAITYVKILGYIGNNTLVKCSLQTGRTHQIRVHMAYIGHCIVNDVLYSNTTNNDLCLHSYSVSLLHPLTQQKLYVKCDDIPFLSKEDILKYKL